MNLKECIEVLKLYLEQDECADWIEMIECLERELEGKQNFLDKMEAKYPGTKNSLLKTVEKLG